MTSLLLTVGSDCCFSTYHYRMYRTNNSQGLVCLDMDKFDNIFTEQKYRYKEVKHDFAMLRSWSIVYFKLNEIAIFNFQ